MGLKYARRAVALAPKDGNLVNTLAVGEYRIGRWTDCIAAATRSNELEQRMDPINSYFLAMAHWQEARKDEARKWFDEAVKWTKEKEPRNAELRQFWTEAAGLLGQPGPPAVGPRAPGAPTAQ
jgi:hypothetical protein